MHRVLRCGLYRDPMSAYSRLTHDLMMGCVLRTFLSRAGMATSPCSCSALVNVCAYRDGERRHKRLMISEAPSQLNQHPSASPMLLSSIATCCARVLSYHSGCVGRIAYFGRTGGLSVFIDKAGTLAVLERGLVLGEADPRADPGVVYPLLGEGAGHNVLHQPFAHVRLLSVQCFE